LGCALSEFREKFAACLRQTERRMHPAGNQLFTSSVLRVAGMFLVEICNLEARGAEVIPAGLERTISVLAAESPMPEASALQIAGETVYQVSVSAGGVPREWILDAAGVPLHVQLLDREIPSAIRIILQNEVRAGKKVISFARTYEEGQIVYEAEVGSLTAHTNITFSHAGKIISREVPLSALPPLIKKVLNKRFPGCKMEHCFRSEEDGDVYFTVTLPDAVKPRWVTFDTDGDIEVETSRILAADLAEPVREAVQATLHLPGPLGPGDSVRILKNASEDGVVFEVWAFSEGKIKIFWVKPDGTVFDAAP